LIWEIRIVILVVLLCGDEVIETEAIHPNENWETQQDEIMITPFIRREEIR
jgi:hypothetical protein